MQHLESQGKYIFSREDAAIVAKEEGIPVSQLNVLLFKLVKNGKVLRLRKGWYAGFGLFPGQIQAHPFAVGTAITAPSFISHWSALQHHGLTEQIPQIVTVSSTKKFVFPRAEKQDSKDRRNVEILGIHYEFFHIYPSRFFGIEEMWVDERFKISISDKERTLVDLFAYSGLFGGMGEVLGIMEQALSSIDLKKLIGYAIQYGEKSLCKRLGWVLQHFGEIPAQEKELLIKNIQGNGYSLLDPRLSRKGKCNSDWMIVENLNS
jgi:predicted transcriptional regulator of viral defense system